MIFHNLAVLLSTSHASDQPAQLEDLDEAIRLSHEALNVQHPSHANQHRVLDTFTSCLIQQFKLSGQHEDPDKGISLCKDALKLQTAHNFPDQSLPLYHLVVHQVYNSTIRNNARTWTRQSICTVNPSTYLSVDILC
jgi:hypothetical protein